MPDIIPRRQSCPERAGRQSDTGPTDPALLTQRTGHVIIGPAIVRFSGPARDQHFCRAGLRRIAIEALALLETFDLAEPIGAGLAVRRAVGRNRTDRAPGHHGGWL